MILQKILDETIRAEIDHANWEEILPRVLKYAVARAKKYAWLGQANCDPHDLVNEAIALVYGVSSRGSIRKWNRERYPDLADFLISIISSITSHDAEHFENFPHEHFGSQEPGSLDTLETEASESLNSVSKTPNPEEKTIRFDLARKVITHIENLIKGDEEMEMVFLCLEEGVSKPKEIAQETGYDIKKVYNILRRFREKIKNINPSLIM